MLLFFARHGRTTPIEAGRLSTPDELLTQEGVAERDCTPYTGQGAAGVFSQSEEVLIAGGTEPNDSVYART